MPFLIQLWFYVTPIVYSSSEIPERWRLVYALNPLTGVVEGFRWALLGTQQTTSGAMIAVSAASSVFILISGMFYFRRMERTFADMV